MDHVAIFSAAVIDVEKGRDNLGKAENLQKSARKKKVKDAWYFLNIFYASLLLQILSGYPGNYCSGCSFNTPSRYYYNIFTLYINYSNFTLNFINLSFGHAVFLVQIMVGNMSLSQLCSYFYGPTVYCQISAIFSILKHPISMEFGKHF